MSCRDKGCSFCKILLNLIGLLERRLCRQLFRFVDLTSRKLVDAFSFFSGIKVHCNNLWILDKHTLQCAQLSMVEKEFGPVISENNESENLDDYRDGV